MEWCASTFQDTAHATPFTVDGKRWAHGCVNYINSFLSSIDLPNTKIKLFALRLGYLSLYLMCMWIENTISAVEPHAPYTILSCAVILRKLCWTDRSSQHWISGLPHRKKNLLSSIEIKKSDNMCRKWYLHFCDSLESPPITASWSGWSGWSGH